MNAPPELKFTGLERLLKFAKTPPTPPPSSSFLSRSLNPMSKTLETKNNSPASTISNLSTTSIIYDSPVIASRKVESKTNSPAIKAIEPTSDDEFEQL